MGHSIVTSSGLRFGLVIAVQALSRFLRFRLHLRNYLPASGLNI